MAHHRLGEAQHFCLVSKQNGAQKCCWVRAKAYTEYFRGDKGLAGRWKLGWLDGKNPRGPADYLEHGSYARGLTHSVEHPGVSILLKYFQNDKQVCR